LPVERPTKFELRAILQAKIDRCLNDQIIDGPERVWRQPIKVAVERMMLGYTLPMKFCELPQRHSIRNAFTQLPVVPVLDALENK